jgi:hypothetical protein
VEAIYGAYLAAETGRRVDLLPPSSGMAS